MRIDQLWRYPVKSFGGERIDAAVIEADGLRGDHLWTLVDAESGNIASAKRFRRYGLLLTCSARLLNDDDPRDRAALELTLADGTVVRGDDPDVDDLLSKMIGHDVRLEPRDRTYDEAPLHLVSRSAVEALGTGDPTDVTLRRFRPQLVVDTPGTTGFVEDEWIGRRVSVGSVVLEPHKRTARCVMVTLPHQEVPARRDMLREVTHAHQVPNVPEGRPMPCIGVYATVTTSGAITIGDEIDVGRADYPSTAE
ncbi:MOSC domain-containing protein [Rhodococcus rhodochrous]|uniref:MOSC domain-containing protein n=1 Tax=Rhodococcus rhodochrous TaxID=1829 RepID=A0AA46WUX6_RHORH|nr:MOSC N-terminal beta barrel domain-containing protein [Rhodococcus rhodochrous]UZF44717.1 MOSC domain-containing protein [Rhodococcus rhodochrous]